MSQAPEDIILSLPTPPTIKVSPGDEPTKEVGTSGAALEVSGSGAAPTSLRLEALVLRDYKIASKLFSGMLLLIDVNDY